MRQFWLRAATIALIALGGVTTVVSPAAARDAVAAPGDGRQACEDMAKQDLTNLPDAPTAIIEAQYVAASSSAPAHCVVAGYVARAIGFAVVFSASYKFNVEGRGA